MLLTQKPEDLIPDFLTVDPANNAPRFASLILGKRHPGNEVLHRKLTDVMEGKRRLDVKEQDELFRTVFDHLGITVPEQDSFLKRIDNFFEQQPETARFTHWDVAGRGLFEALPNLKALRDPILRLEESSNRLWGLRDGKDIDAVRDELARLSYMSSGYPEQASAALANRPPQQDWRGICLPLFLPGLLHLLALFDAALDGPSHLNVIMPRKSKDLTIERPMRRWLDQVITKTGLKTRTAAWRALLLTPAENQDWSHAEWKGSSKKAEASRYDALKRDRNRVPSHPKFDEMLDNLAKNADLDSEAVKSLCLLSWFVTFAENMLRRWEDLACAFPDGFQPDLVFHDYEDMYGAARALVEQERPRQT